MIIESRVLTRYNTKRSVAENADEKSGMIVDIFGFICYHL